MSGLPCCSTQSATRLEDLDYRANRGIDPAMACAFGKQACRSGHSVYFATATQLFENLVMAQADGSLPKLRRMLVKTQRLIIDDFGIGGVDVHFGPILLDIINQQSMRGSLLITSQFPYGKWYDLFNDPTVADAILDRIVQRAH